MSIRIRRYVFTVALFGIAILAFSLFAVNAKADTGTSPAEVHVCMGDSITAGAYLTNYDTYPGFLGRFTGGTTINSGIGGENTTQILARFTPDVLAHSPTYVFLMGGTNDVLQNLSAATIESNLATMCNMASTAGAKTFLLNIPPATIFTSAQNAEVAQVNAWIATQASANVILVNDHDILASGTTLIPAYDFGDGEHPSSLGMAVIAKKIVQVAQTNGIFTNVKFWTAASNGAASTAANWAGGVAPVTGDRLVFDSGSIKNCSFDQAMTYGSISTISTYTGILSIGANVGTTDDQVYFGGTLTGSFSYTDMCSGDFVQHGGVITNNVLKLIMAGSGKKLQVSAFNFYDLTFNGNTSIVFDYAFAAHDIVIAPGVTVTNVNGLGGLEWQPSFGGDTFTNNGHITGTGPLILQLDGADLTLAPGTIDCPTTVSLSSLAAASRTLTLSTSSSVGSLTIISHHTTNTITLNLNGHTLNAPSIVISTRGVLSSSLAGAMINATGVISVATGGTLDATRISTITCTSCNGAGNFVGAGTTAFIIPAGTTAIAASAFASCTVMNAVTILSGLTSIGASAFQQCGSLTSITFLGLVAPTSVGANWIATTPAGIRGHAYVASNFPAPGLAWNGLTMGTVISALPNSPTGLTAIAGNAQVSLNWTAPAFNGGSAIDYYVIYQNGIALTDHPTGSTTIITGLTNGQSYTFNVSAHNIVGLSARSGAVSSTPFTVPNVPTGLTAVPGSAHVTLNWTAPAFNGGSAVPGYKLYRAATETGTYTEIASPSGTTYTDTGLTNGQAYWYKVSAVNAAGEGAKTAQLTSVPFIGPNAPTGLTAIPGNSRVSLNWTAPAFNGGSAIDYYVIYQNGIALTDHPTGSTTIITGLNNGQSYSFTVAAHNPAGIGPQSDSSAVTPCTVPSSPVLTSATAGNLSVTLVWTAPASNGYSPLTGYEMCFGTSVVNTTWTKFSTVGASVLSEKITGLTAGTTYYFGVKALNVAGSSAMSNNWTSVPYTIPGAPTLTSATAGVNSAVLVWTAPASNGGSPITGYLVYYGPSGVMTQFDDVRTAMTLNVNVTGLTAGTHYYFGVKAANAAGNSSMSNVLNITVLAIPGTPTGLNTTAIYGKVTLTWTAPVNTGGSPIIDYKIYRGISAASLVKIGNSSIATFVDNTAVPGSTFYYKISSVNVVGEGNQSVYATALVPALLAVTGKIVDANGKGLAGIMVALENGLSVLTDAQGNFTIMASPGSHTLTISGPDIETKKVDASVSTSNLTIGSISTSKGSASNSTLIIVAAVVASALIVAVVLLIVWRRKKGKR
ncbi:MAG: fibronectin type III domain-containing protein [Methanomassiliicoccales archaeon]